MNTLSFQDIIANLTQFWCNHGCMSIQPYDMPMGAGTFHPATFFRSLGPEPWNACYVQPSRRPTDGRYGENPNRLQRYYQFQVILKPSPPDFQNLYLESLAQLGINKEIMDIRFVEDNWESPTLGASGLGWEVWLNGMEITQFTYFQRVAGYDLSPISGELTYGLERLAMYLQNKNNVYDLVYANTVAGHVLYGDIYQQNEKDQSHFNFTYANGPMLIAHFDAYEQQAQLLCKQGLAFPGYDMAILATHCFNLLDARKVIGATQRQEYILRIRSLTKLCADAFLHQRKEAGFPLSSRRNIP